MRIAMMFMAATLAVAPACKKKPADTTEGSGSAGSAAMGSSEGSAMGSGSAGSAMAGSDMGSAAGSGSAAMGSGGGSADQAMAHHAGMCPSTVFGSTTTAAIKGKDVVVTISSDDKDAILAIQKRTDELLATHKEKKSTGPGHDQKGEHGGGSGLCPVHIPEGAAAKAKHEKNGITVTITPKDKPDELKTEIDGRIQKAADWVKANIPPGDKGNQGGVGGGKNNEGMNHSGSGDAKGMERKKGGDGSGTGGGGGKGTGAGTGGGKK
jgi:hypothetical protein